MGLRAASDQDTANQDLFFCLPIIVIVKRALMVFLLFFIRGDFKLGSQ